MFAGHTPGVDDEEHKKKFEAARKAHYNMRDLLAHKTVRLAEGTGLLATMAQLCKDGSKRFSLKALKP